MTAFTELNIKPVLQKKSNHQNDLPALEQEVVNLLRGHVFCHGLENGLFQSFLIFIYISTYYQLPVEGKPC